MEYIVQGVEIESAPSLTGTGPKCRHFYEFLKIPAESVHKTLSVETNLSTMEQLYTEIEDIMFTEAKRRCAVKMCLPNLS